MIDNLRMTDILDLPGWTVLKTTQSDGEYVIEAEYTVQPTNCPKCAVVDTAYKHGVKPIKYRDSPIRGASTVILAQVQRYRCKHCKETFLQHFMVIQLPHLNPESHRNQPSRMVSV